ncbi:bifunctional DNA primase/polymerase [Sinisalibacter lacisalsi]|uniref:DNA primase/polymerase bifunctional N-terminal domain-containing protein n=1 Tax=Sinisalibacter lacisalsi TaxID=1526570 RepID=A0ABQ1Q8U7_9RHOB|nr:bifunctional DNA primase/polymerase [Sinisalibacter lacisalsi]GGD19447.1 hypothetical protein GCM10011358_00040 [Sinisalibacter lacisalsi]
MTMLDHALEYAARGWAVFPVHGIVDGICTCGQADCSSAGKHPLGGRGLKDATTDLNAINEWWSNYPGANIGIATGPISGLFVVDVDDGPSKTGFVSLQTLEAEHGQLPRDVCVRTGSGGLHIYLMNPQINVRNSAGKLGENIDIRGDGGYVVAPPSHHVSGNLYAWEEPHVA